MRFSFTTPNLFIWIAGRCTSKAIVETTAQCEQGSGNQISGGSWLAIQWTQNACVQEELADLSNRGPTSREMLPDHVQVHDCNSIADKL